MLLSVVDLFNEPIGNLLTIHSERNLGIFLTLKAYTDHPYSFTYAQNPHALYILICQFIYDRLILSEKDFEGRLIYFEMILLLFAANYAFRAILVVSYLYFISYLVFHNYFWL